jgi:hypothetical protein
VDIHSLLGPNAGARSKSECILAQKVREAAIELLVDVTLHSKGVILVLRVLPSLVGISGYEDTVTQ